MKLLLLACLCQTATVEVHDCAPSGIGEAAHALLSARLPQARLQWTNVAPAELAAELRASRAPAIVFGADAFTLRDAAAAGLLERYPDAVDLPEEYRDPRGLFFAPLLLPIVLVFDERRLARADLPGNLDELPFDRRLDQRLVLCPPAVMPALWIGLLQHHIGAGHDEDWAFAWFAALDARTREYAELSRGVLEALRTGRAAVGLAYASDLEELEPLEPGTLQRAVVPPGLPARWIGLALGQRAAACAAACDVLAALASPSLCAALARERQLLVAPRAETASTLLPIELRAADLTRFTERWNATIRGKGQRLEWLDDALDLGLGVLFVVVAILVWRHLKKAEPAT